VETGWLASSSLGMWPRIRSSAASQSLSFRGDLLGLFGLQDDPLEIEDGAVGDRRMRSWGVSRDDYSMRAHCLTGVESRTPDIRVRKMSAFENRTGLGPHAKPGICRSRTVATPKKRTHLGPHPELVGNGSSQREGPLAMSGDLESVGS
jgi:hypothetical protein